MEIPENKGYFTVWPNKKNQLLKGMLEPKWNLWNTNYKRTNFLKFKLLNLYRNVLCNDILLGIFVKKTRVFIKRLLELITLT